MQARSASTVTRATGSCAWIQVGGSPRVSTTEYEDGSRARLLCHRYVCPSVPYIRHILRRLADYTGVETQEASLDGNDSTLYASRLGAIRLQVLIVGGISLDRLRLQQENPPHDALRPQGLPRPQPCRCRPSVNAQQDLRR